VPVTIILAGKTSAHQADAARPGLLPRSVPRPSRAPIQLAGGLPPWAECCMAYRRTEHIGPDTRTWPALMFFHTHALLTGRPVASRAPGDKSPRGQGMHRVPLWLTIAYHIRAGR